MKYSIFYNSARRIKWHQNYRIWKMFWVIETKTMNHKFRFNNPKQFSNWIIFMSFHSSRRVIKNAVFFLNVQGFWIIFFSIYRFYWTTCFRCNTQSQLHSQLSRKLQRFRIYRKNKKCSIFMNFSNINKQWATFFWPDVTNN